MQLVSDLGWNGIVGFAVLQRQICDRFRQRPYRQKVQFSKRELHFPSAHGVPIILCALLAWIDLVAE